MYTETATRFTVLCLLVFCLTGVAAAWTGQGGLLASDPVSYPADGSSIDPSLAPPELDVEDGNRDFSGYTGTAFFYTGSNTLIGTCEVQLTGGFNTFGGTTSCAGDPATDLDGADGPTYSSADSPGTYEWYAETEGGDQTSTFSFTIGSPPNQPSPPSPSDGAQGVQTQPAISVPYSHPSGIGGQIEFYRGDGTFIGEVTGLSSGDDAFAIYSDATDRGTTYEWYAVAIDNNGLETQSQTFSFTTETNDPPTVSNFDPGDGSSGVPLSPTISAKYSDPEGDSGTLTFFTGGGTQIGSVNVNDGETGSVSYNGANTESTTFQWSVVAEDDFGGSTTSATKSFTTKEGSILESRANSNAPRGALWVQSSDLHWADGSTEYFLKDANVVSSSASGPNGAMWVQSTTVRWIDQNGNERIYEGPVVNTNVGGPNGAVWQQGQHLHYIDQNGNERITDGT
jgi:hypothetical protein